MTGASRLEGTRCIDHVEWRVSPGPKVETTYAMQDRKTELHQGSTQPSSVNWQSSRKKLSRSSLPQRSMQVQVSSFLEKRSPIRRARPAKFKLKSCLRILMKTGLLISMKCLRWRSYLRTATTVSCTGLPTRTHRLTSLSTTCLPLANLHESACRN